MSSTLQGNDMRLEACNLPGAGGKFDQIQGSHSHKTLSTNSGVGGSGSVSDECCSSSSREDESQSSGNRSRRRAQSSLKDKAISEEANSNDQDDSQSTADTDGEDFASIFQNGPAYSLGSANHPNGCEPCVHYCFSKRRGCNRGDDCSFCHNFHESKLQQKRQRWKGNKKPLVKLQHKSVEIIENQVSKQATGEQPELPLPVPIALPVPKLAYADAELARQPLVPKLAYALPTMGYLADPMTVVPSSVGEVPPPGGQLEGYCNVPLPPGLHDFGDFRYVDFVCG
jgi:hypothetical protein